MPNLALDTAIILAAVTDEDDAKDTPSSLASAVVVVSFCIISTMYQVFNDSAAESLPIAVLAPSANRNLLVAFIN